LLQNDVNAFHLNNISTLPVSTVPERDKLYVIHCGHENRCFAVCYRDKNDT